MINDIVTAVATLVLAYLTYKYVRLTHHMLEETRTARKGRGVKAGIWQYTCQNIRN